jgi:ribosomal protein L22
MEGISKEQQQNTLKRAGQHASALIFNPELAIKRLEQDSLAAKNSGDEDDAQFFERLAKAAADPTQGPATAFKALVQSSAYIPGAKEMFETIDKGMGTAREEALFPSKLTQAQQEAKKAQSDAEIRAEEAKNVAEKIKNELAQQAAQLGLTNAQKNQALASTSKLGVETKKAALELAALEATGGRDPEKTFAQEEKIRKEWQGRSKMYSELQGTFNTLQASANSANGPGDIALITGFMKMLDPGSVVRETEFATARDTAGLFTQLQNRLEKAQNGQLLSPKQRSEYVDLSQKYLDSAQKKAEQEKKDLGIVVKNYRLNPENVFGAEQAPPPPLPTSATVGGVTYQRPAGFTDAQWRDYLKANGVIQ